MEDPWEPDSGSKNAYGECGREIDIMQDSCLDARSIKRVQYVDGAGDDLRPVQRLSGRYRA